MRTSSAHTHSITQTYGGREGDGGTGRKESEGGLWGTKMKWKKGVEGQHPINHASESGRQARVQVPREGSGEPGGAGRSGELEL